MSDQELSKKERKELKKQEHAEALKRKEAEERAKTVRTWTIVVISAVVIVAFLGWLIQNAPEKGDIYDETPEQINVVDETDNKKGASDENAKLTIVEYSDFECPACGAYYPILKQLTETYGDDLQFVYRHLPIRHIHPNAELAARYAEAAGIQGKFFEMHDLIFESQGSWAGTSARVARNTFTELAEQLELDIEKLEVDLNSEVVTTKIETDRIDAIGAGANSTPTFFVDGERIQNPQNFTEFEAFVRQEIGLEQATAPTIVPTLQLDGITPKPVVEEDAAQESTMESETDDEVMVEAEENPSN